MSGEPQILRVANCSGFFGDRISAAREMVEGGPIDVLTGDWLAELTMYILHKTRERSGGYARTFLQQLEEVLPTCIERGITIVSNAGGLNPEGLATAVTELARRQGLSVRVASVSGDDITERVTDLMAAGNEFVNLDTGEPLPPGAPVVTNGSNRSSCHNVAESTICRFQPDHELTSFAGSRIALSRSRPACSLRPGPRLWRRPSIQGRRRRQLGLPHR